MKEIKETNDTQKFIGGKIPREVAELLDRIAAKERRSNTKQIEVLIIERARSLGIIPE